MKNNIDNNQELQIVMEGFVQTISEMREDITVIKENTNPNSNDNPAYSPLTADLLNKIADIVDNAKKAIDEEDLKKFINIIISVTTQLQEDANKASAEFLNQKIAELNELVKKPSIVENRYSIDFKSSKTFIALVILILGIGCSLYYNYDQFQESKRLKHNDIKYRYVQMKGGVSQEHLFYLNKSYAERSQYRDSIQRKVIDFEATIRRKVYNQTVKEQSEKEEEQINKKLEELAQ